MLRSSPWPVLFFTLLAGCAGVRNMPPPVVRRVAVWPPANRTSDALVVTGSSLLERYALRTERVTVGDVLSVALREQLEQRGIAAAAADAVQAASDGHTATTAAAAAELAHRARLDDPTLFIAIDRWEPDNPSHPAFVIVALDATLIEPATGKVLWHLHRSARPVATPGTVTSGSAHEIAARKVSAELLEGWPIIR